MNSNIQFMALGGGQNVGASCYFLKLDDTYIMLDCGIGYDKNIIFEPCFNWIIEPPFMQSMHQLQNVFISHAHMDHIGALPQLFRQNNDISIYMTELTSIFCKYQLYDRTYINTNNLSSENERLGIKNIIDKISTVTYNTTLNFKKYKVEFFNAGHIPGAAMILIIYKRIKILYTGDFSEFSTPLTDGYLLPQNLHPDIVIMCGLHAKHPCYSRNNNNINNILNRIEDLIRNNCSVYCKVHQLSKGIEFLKILTKFMINKGYSDIPIYIEKNFTDMIHEVERLNVMLWEINCHSINNLKFNKNNHLHIVIGSSNYQYNNEVIVNVDFSLHEDFQGLCKFIKDLNPKVTVVVHCGKERENENNNTIEQQVMKNSESRTQFIFADNNEIYNL
ncbi:MBL fold metallo-hydrolase [Clostridium sp. HCP1S3_B4]|uniref:MBL fold metallo-hydrolase n=1 Tax=unclassified Clostridium TaxID=2614128 RepID=UPI003F896B94